MRSISARHIIAFIAVSVCLIAPMFVIKSVTTSEREIQGAATVTVALGTIVRSNGRNILKSTFMSAVRTGLRTMTRRLVRSILPVLLRLFLPAFKTSTQQDVGNPEVEHPQPIIISLGMGLIVLTLSFYAVVELNSNVQFESLQRGLSLWTVAILASLSLLIHYGVMFWRGLVNNVKISLRTPLDGIILQAYFTGALSYLPLASDINLEGTVENKARCSGETLMIMLGISVILDSIGHVLDWVVLEIWAAQILLYVFVISFPLRPLEGSDVLEHSKLWWFGIFVFVLAAFLFNMPEEFYAIL